MTRAIAPLLAGARHVTVHGGGYPAVYKARTMTNAKGTRNGGSTLTGPQVGEDRWPPDMHVHVKTIPPWLSWTVLACAAAVLFLLAFIAFQVRECARWNRSVAVTLAQKFNVPIDEGK